LPSAEIITIGTELLLGEVLDTNTRKIALFLREEGIDLYRTITIGDNEQRIANAVRESISRANLIITTGGLGPTVDDPTRQAIAIAVDSELIFLPELWDQITQRFSKQGRIPPENNKKQAYIPKGAVPVENKVGTAPAFYFKTENCLIISLPGVPAELEYLLENQVKGIIKNNLDNPFVIHSLVIHTSGIGESMIDEKIADLETLPNPTVGIVAYPAQTDIRITAKAKDLLEAKMMISEVSEIIHKRLPGHIYGYDSDSLPLIVTQLIKRKQKKIFFWNTELNNHLLNMFLTIDGTIDSAMLPNNVTMDTLVNNNESLDKNNNNFLLLFSNLSEDQENQAVLQLKLNYQNFKDEKSYFFGGHNNLSELWAINTTLNYLRIFLEKA